jgi:hypothetical protein
MHPAVLVIFRGGEELLAHLGHLGRFTPGGVTLVSGEPMPSFVGLKGNVQTLRERLVQVTDDAEGDAVVPGKQHVQTGFHAATGRTEKAHLEFLSGVLGGP